MISTIHPISFVATPHPEACPVLFCQPHPGPEHCERWFVYTYNGMKEMLKRYRDIIAKELPKNENFINTTIEISQDGKLLDTFTFTKTKTNKVICHSKNHFKFTYEDFIVKNHF